jgi:hypothetical protein
LELAGKIRLRQGAIGEGRIIGDARHDPKLMHAAVAGAVGLVFEADFPDRAVLLFEDGNHVLLAEAIWHQPEHRVFRQHRRPLSGIWHDKSAGTAEGRLGVAQEALVGVVTRAEAVGVGMELRKYGIELAHSRDRRAVRHVGAGIAGRFQLPRAFDAFEKRRLLIGIDGSAGRRMRADQRRMWNLDAAVLQVARGIVQSAAHARIMLRESGCRCEKTK